MMVSDDSSKSGQALPQADIVTPTTVVAKGSFFGRMLWWMKLIQVRFRFIFIVLISAAIVSQWGTLQSLWDRWIWNSITFHASNSVSGDHEYFCPMDPGVLSAWPAICPICNMDLVPRKKSDAQFLPEGVVSRMQLTPYRVQLAGIRTVAIEARELKYQISFSGILKSLPSREGEPNLTGFEVAPTAFDAELFNVPRVAKVRVRSIPEMETSATVLGVDAGTRHDAFSQPLVRILLDDAASLPAGSAVTALVMVGATDVLSQERMPMSEDEIGGIVCVPESAVVDRAGEYLVYVETMPGMFDGTAIKVGRRMGSYYPVLSGLKAGQRVASAGAFLIDAETRLNPGLAAGYFGANTPALTTASATAPVRRKNSAGKTPLSLTAEDQQLADRQGICPVTKLSLESMGGPIPVMIGEKKFFICCAGCEDRLRSDPEKYLANLPATE
jgi:hypothetical protein